MWGARYNYQFYKLFNEPDIIKVMKVNLLKLLLQPPWNAGAELLQDVNCT
jgi:hypothetical protein